ncbi:hypothetical protein C1645_874956 [Glomus cerebriforme]|uniref:Uncharacterized protein n=1 Tax=Glomus cerebriforme TaxID=658196 RepID=A0A397T4A7_9GLOM|nr:hypothetical protein C1645_874956 [Glomus cerebriforme]
MDLDSERYDHETPEMWCSRIHGLFRKILEENPRILSGNGYITMCGKLIERSDRVHVDLYQDNHLKRCISRNTISNEHAKINRLRLEFFSPSTSHSEKDKLASISYNYDTCSISYEAYFLAKATIAENMIPSAPNFEPACISITSGNQEEILEVVRNLLLNKKVNGKKDHKPLANTSNLQEEIIKKPASPKLDSSASVIKK